MNVFVVNLKRPTYNWSPNVNLKEQMCSAGMGGGATKNIFSLEGGPLKNIHEIRGGPVNILETFCDFPPPPPDFMKFRGVPDPFLRVSTATLPRLYCVLRVPTAFLPRCYGDHGDPRATPRRPGPGRRTSAFTLNMSEVIAVALRPSASLGSPRRLSAFSPRPHGVHGVPTASWVAVGTQ